MLILHFCHHSRLLLLLFNSLVVASIGLCLCILHFRLLFISWFSFFLLYRLNRYNFLSLFGRRFTSLTRYRASRWTLFRFFLGFLLLFFLFFGLPFSLLDYFLELFLLLIINNWNDFGKLFNRQVIFRWLTVRSTRRVAFSGCYEFLIFLQFLLEQCAHIRWVIAP